MDDERIGSGGAVAAHLVRIGKRASRWAERELDAAGGKHPLTWRQFHVLAAIALLHNPTHGALANVLGVTPAVVTGLVDRLAVQRYVVRERDRADARAIHVLLTADGRAAHARAERHLLDRISRAMSTLALLELDALTRAIELLDRVPDEACPACGGGVHRSDRFCAECGVPLVR